MLIIERSDYMKKSKYKITVKSFFKHLGVVNRHRFKVFCLCVKAGIPWRGFVHDLSKYSPTEFLEGAKYFAGDHSPIMNCKRENGYSAAWLHHKGRNRHHYEYWYDYTASDNCPVIPYKYFAEMVCDSIAAGMIYQGKNWTKSYQLDYWFKTRGKAKINPKIDFLLTKVYTDLSKDGLKRVVNKKYLMDSYTKLVGEI